MDDEEILNDIAFRQLTLENANLTWHFNLVHLLVMKSQFLPHLRTIYRYRFDQPAIYFARKYLQK